MLKCSVSSSLQMNSYAHVVVYWHQMHPNTLPNYETHRICSDVNAKFTMPFDTPEEAKNAELIIKNEVLPYYTFGSVRSEEKSWRSSK